jgi:hypothetical protein
MRPKNMAMMLAAALSLAWSPPSWAADDGAVALSHLETTNLNITSAAIVWVTDHETLLNRVEVRAEGEEKTFSDSYGLPHYVHFVDLSSLKPGTRFEYRVLSDSSIWDNGGAWYSFRTLESAFPVMPGIVFGMTVDRQGDSLERVLVRILLTRPDGTVSLPFTLLTDVSGNWVLNTGNLKDSFTGLPLTAEVGDRLKIEFVPNYWTALTDSSAVLSGVSPQSLGNKVLDVFDPSLGLRGDVDGNGKIDIFDLLELLKVLGGRLSLTSNPRLALASDVDANAKVDIFDLLALLKLLKGTV